MGWHHLPSVTLTAGLFMVACVPGAFAQTPAAESTPTALPTQTEACASTWLDPQGPQPADAHLTQLGMDRAWQLSRGAGQRIAIIDTGVAPHRRLPQLRGSGDVILGGDGLQDCDAHGTVVAGLAAAIPAGDGFSGIAPETVVISVRQSSALFSGQSAAAGPGGDAAAASSGSGTLSTLATAVRIAADAGATVINISEVACVPRDVPINDAALTDALRYAVYERDIVVVAAAGNTEGPCAAGNPTHRSVSAGASEAQWVTAASPAWYDDLVLTVGAVDARGIPADFSLPGPWVDVAAPGVGLTSLSVTGPGSRGVVPDLGNTVVSGRGRAATLEGTSFAAPLVAGVAALIRARFPELTAAQVRDRIIGTAIGADASSDGTGADDAGDGRVAGGGAGQDMRVGAGVVDPVAALTAPTRPRTVPEAGSAPLRVAAPVAPDYTQRRWALWVAAAGGATAAVVLLVLAARSALRPASSRRFPR